MQNAHGYTSGAVASSDPALLGADLVETDRRYFELGSRRARLPGAEIAWLDGMADLPAAGVVHRVIPEELGDPARWVGEATTTLIDAGFTHGRIYLDDPFEPLEAELASGGWTMRREPGLVALESVPTRGRAIELAPVSDGEDWAAKEEVHRADGARPDGHQAPASRWVAMERARVATGELEAWLVLRGGIVCGTVCSMTEGAVLRNKNLVVHPDHRRSGVGLSVLAGLDVMARARGLVMGTFSVVGADGERLYRAAGMSVVVEQREWSRPLEAT
jgi:GNAT superfamily N-acetyltransferase